jgi:hypothetical protein
LTSIQRIRPIDAKLVVQEATRTGQVIGLRIAETDEEEPAPWARLPSGRIHVKPVAGPLPPELKAVLAQRLYIEKAGLPPPLLRESLLQKRSTVTAEQTLIGDGDRCVDCVPGCP